METAAESSNLLCTLIKKDREQSVKGKTPILKQPQVKMQISNYSNGTESAPQITCNNGCAQINDCAENEPAEAVLEKNLH